MTLQAQADATSSPIGGKMSSFGGVKAVSVFFGFDLQNGFVLLIPPGHAMRRLRRINHLPRNWLCSVKCRCRRDHPLERNETHETPLHEGSPLAAPAPVNGQSS